jgi:hypothetical protein
LAEVAFYKDPKKEETPWLVGMNTQQLPSLAKSSSVSVSDQRMCSEMPWGLGRLSLAL